jgi:AraC-like DNA-binding protein
MRIRMRYLGRTPPPPLDRFIERIWYCSDRPSHSRERVLPGGGAIDLVINLVDDDLRIYDPNRPASIHAHSGALVVGTRTQSFLVDPRQRESVMGVHFRPGRAFPFLGTSPAEILNTHVPLEDLWASVARNLREQLLEARSPNERFRILEAALLERLRHARTGHPAVDVAVKALGSAGTGARVADVAEAVSLSRRRLIEIFEREVGVTPKLFARLERFHRVKQRIASLGSPPSWATFAVECGYFDQSHMLRDFVEFSSMTPAGYLQRAGEETRFDHLVHAYPGH